MSITVTSPECALPGEIHSPGLAAWKVTVASARTAAPAISPVEASTPLGTSQAHTKAPPAALIAAIADRAGSRGSPLKPVPRMASTIAAGVHSSAPGSNGCGCGCPEAVEVGPRVAAQLLAGPPAEARRPPGRPRAAGGPRPGRRRRCCPCRRRRRSGPREPAGARPRPGPPRRAPSARARRCRDRRSPTRRWPAAAAASGRGSSQAGSTARRRVVSHEVRRSPPRRPRCGVCVSEIRTLTPSSAARCAAAPCSATRGGPPAEVTSMSRKLQASSPSALATASLAQKRAARCWPGRAREPRSRARRR